MICRAHQVTEYWITLDLNLDKSRKMDMHFLVQNIVVIITAILQLVMEGYKWHFNETVLTVWSAPNYCYRSDIELNIGYFL